MTTPQNTKPALAEVLVRQVLGSTDDFERVCSQRGLSLIDAVTQALQGWMGSEHVTRPAVPPLTLLLPDPSDCPQGQEKEWLSVCEHDLRVLEEEQRRCYFTKNVARLSQVNQSIEKYLQARSELRDRLEVA
jgi:hypothetical protein